MTTTILSAWCPTYSQGFHQPNKNAKCTTIQCHEKSDFTVLCWQDSFTELPIFHRQPCWPKPSRQHQEALSLPACHSTQASMEGFRIESSAFRCCSHGLGKMMSISKCLLDVCNTSPAQTRVNYRWDPGNRRPFKLILLVYLLLQDFPSYNYGLKTQLKENTTASFSCALHWYIQLPGHLQYSP